MYEKKEKKPASNTALAHSAGNAQTQTPTPAPSPVQTLCDNKTTIFSMRWISGVRCGLTNCIGRWNPFCRVVDSV